MQKILEFETALRNIESLNPNFATGFMRVCYHGKNHNGSTIPKETLEKAIPTMFNCPIVAHYYRSSDSIGSHDKELIIKDGEMAIVPVTEPLGVVPKNDVYFWETVTEKDGTEHEYLVMPVVLWKRQEATAHVIDVGSVAESMEVTFDETHEQDGEVVVDKLTAEAFCLLESAKPCFESAAVNIFNTAFKEQFSLMAQDWKELCGGEEFSIAKFNEQGGTQVENLNEPIIEPVVEEPIAEPVIEEQPEEIPAEPIAEPVVEPAEPAEPAEPLAEANPEPAEEPEQFALRTYEERRNALTNALPRGDDICYYLADFDDEYVYVNIQDFKCGGGGKHVRAKYAIGETGAEINDQFEEITLRWCTQEEAARLDADANELAQLRAWHAEAEAARAQTLRDDFNELSEVEGFNEVIEAAVAGTINYEDAQEKLFALKGKHAFALEHKEEKPVVVQVIETKNTKPGRYNGLLSTRAE